MKRLMTGRGTLPNVQMTYRLMELGALAAQDRRACAYFTAELGQDSLRGYADALAGTAVLRGLEAFLQEFGHRGPYERSEERRVGKECRSGWSAEHSTKKQKTAIRRTC